MTAITAEVEKRRKQREEQSPKGDDEDDLITEIALEDEGISDVPDDADDLRKHENVKVQYIKALAYIPTIRSYERYTIRAATKHRLSTKKSNRLF